MSPTSSTCAGTSDSGARVSAARYREDTRSWEIVLEDGGARTVSDHRNRRPLGADHAEQHTGYPLVQGHPATHATGPGKHHFAGKRVGIIGTGTTAMQASGDRKDRIN
jgi:cation diffusion facilitator CzcD-associated flavoprotein CzcO